MKENKLNYKIINITALMLLIYITVTNIGTWWNILGRIIQIILPFIIAFTIAYSLTPVVKWLENKGLPKFLAVMIVTIIMILIITFILATILPLVYDQLISLSKNLSEAVDAVSDKFDLNLGNVEGNINKYLSRTIKNIGNIITTGAGDIISKSIGVFGNIIVGFVASIYFLAYMKQIRTGVKMFLEQTSKRSLKYVQCLDTEIGNYIKGLAIFMVIQFFEYSILFRIVNHPNWLILGLLACITTVIPYFGGLITNIVALILASVTSSYTFFGTLIISIIFPQLDGYVISPKVYGKTNNVNPLITIMAVSVGGTLAGVIGIIASLPVYLLLRTTYNFFKRDLKKTVKTIKKAI